jgi:hypothetical protein
MPTTKKGRERRMRKVADREGYRLRKLRGQDAYWLIDVASNGLALGREDTPGKRIGYDLDAIAEYLGDTGPHRHVAAWSTVARHEHQVRRRAYNRGYRLKKLRGQIDRYWLIDDNLGHLAVGENRQGWRIGRSLDYIEEWLLATPTLKQLNQL